MKSFQNRPVTDYLAAREPVFSIEFFPPKDEAGGQQILKTAASLKSQLDPHFVSITYGAGGTTRERTWRFARLLKDEFQFQVMPHLTCVGASRGEISEILQQYREEGFCNVMALRGDPPKGETEFRPSPDGLAYASDLVELIRAEFAGFSVGVAGYPEKHPEADSMQKDLENLSIKVQAGASFITTQLFFDNRQYFNYVESCRARGILLPIIPGIMPVLSLKQIQRFCQFCGATIPAALLQRLESANGDCAQEEAVGVTWALEQIRELLDNGAPGVHLYIMNRTRAALALAEELGKGKLGMRS